jgi:hypothetical protein
MGMNLKNRSLGILMLGSFFEMMGGGSPSLRSQPSPIKKFKTWDEVLIGRGLKRFNIKGIEIIALNQKNAERKYNLYHSK